MKISLFNPFFGFWSPDRAPSWGLLSYIHSMFTTKPVCQMLFPCFTFLRAVPLTVMDSYISTYSHPYSCQSAHPAVNSSSRTQRRLTQGLTTWFISLSLSSFVSIHHSSAVIHLRRFDFYENISHQSFFFQQHRPLSCVFQVFSWTYASASAGASRPEFTLTQTRARVCWCCWFCLHDSRSLCAAGHKSQLSIQKLCPTPLQSTFLSCTLPIPCNFLPPSLYGCFLTSLFFVSESHDRYSRVIRGHQRQFVSFN